MAIWNLVLAVHILAIAVWTGTLAAFFALLPAMAPHHATGIDVVGLRRLFFVTWHAMPVAVLSGYAMAFGFYGLTEAGWPVLLMLLTGTAMAGLFVFGFRGPWRRYQRAGDPADAALLRRTMGVTLGLAAVTVVAATAGHFG